ncbi:uncharacterized protein LOC106174619 [Lingula anatina]|uniref:Uncharacterized protein LOC106174619 n=1 Tax=Lingula anatina TaxID=7574 RepID=A0A1S3JMX5_LINAN|nr:uncharacterized protein LOC106174619 [Lingula anatina]|eukprot:XP_013411730.1 uncharacterized protein LOC106174619 [Lingula anatina]
MHRLTVLTHLALNVGVVSAELSQALVYAIAFGTTAGVLFLAAVALLVFVCLQQRKSKTKKPRSHHMNPVINKYMASIQDFRNEPPIDTSEPNTLYDEDPVPDPDSESFYNFRHNGGPSRPPYYNRSLGGFPQNGRPASVARGRLGTQHSGGSRGQGPVSIGRDPYDPTGQTQNVPRAGGNSYPSRLPKTADRTDLYNPIYVNYFYNEARARGSEGQYRGETPRQISTDSQYPQASGPSQIPETRDQQDTEPRYENTHTMAAYNRKYYLPPDYDYPEENEQARVGVQDRISYVPPSTEEPRSDFQSHLQRNRWSAYSDRGAGNGVTNTDQYVRGNPPASTRLEQKGNAADDTGWTDYDGISFPHDVSKSYAQNWDQPKMDAMTKSTPAIDRGRSTRQTENNLNYTSARHQHARLHSQQYGVALPGIGGVQSRR